ncbi:GGDEF domain-containing protein [Kordiimonas aquimaris]|uniref:GGDEF domain-containing protein n=1 Tax=Kordiimonas aquimaris TaxID=707591 RepID=UPI0021D2CDAC|nr:GGDEF domain-containing protein [Kordiimonas aquimaris]
MIEQTQGIKSTKADINPYVSTLAGKLMRTAADAEMKFDSNGWQLITEVLSYAAAAEQRMCEQQERISYLEQLSVTDELTGIPNRRGLRLSLGQTLAAAARHRETGVLGFIDLDRFKEINDLNGHMAGDAVLRFVAKRLKADVRPTDIVARIAGDEFAVVLTRCSAELGQKRILKLQNDINGSIVNYAGKHIEVNCSVGTTEFDGKSDPALLIENADKSMYEDKQNRQHELRSA